ncbi:hypothetical protein JTB14_027125 [Gonioctena quinquepunctata]|nr:hypothetical protein JTB14_027125 [Gonioctena quinquepunctata]
MLINKILMTLPSFKYFPSAWDSSSNESLNNLTSRLLAEGVAGALPARTFEKRDRKKDENLRHKNIFQKGDFSCDYFKKRRHFKRDCWLQKNEVKREPLTDGLNKTNFALITNEMNTNSDWYLDSGASHYMTFNEYGSVLTKSWKRKCIFLLAIVKGTRLSGKVLLL